MNLKAENEIVDEAERNHFGHIGIASSHILFRAGVVAGRATIHNKDYTAALFSIISEWADEREIILWDESINDLVKRLNQQS